MPEIEHHDVEHIADLGRNLSSKIIVREVEKKNGPVVVESVLSVAHVGASVVAGVTRGNSVKQLRPDSGELKENSGPAAVHSAVAPQVNESLSRDESDGDLARLFRDFRGEIPGELVAVEVDPDETPAVSDLWRDFSGE